jgi:class 3 adenylate cyclase/tetratricopeptide (TPR) repeat protein
MALATSPGQQGRPLDVYAPRLLIDWLHNTPDARYRAVEGSMAFVDISGFTKLTERLARKGRVGAEEMSDILDATFGALLTVAQDDGGDLVKWGGDAVLMLYQGYAHAARAARAAYRMRKELRKFTQLPTSSGRVALKMSVGIHSGEFHFFLVGDSEIHRELIVSGPSASITAEMESVAAAGQIAVSDACAALLPKRILGAPIAGGRLLSQEPALTDHAAPPAPVSTGIDVGQALPPPIRQYLHAASGESEHRPIAVAFVQFSGTDALLNSSGPEALAAALDECVRNVQQAVGAHEVTFFESDINRDGGKIMLTAGAPLSVGSHEERMLRAVRLIADRAGTLAVRVGVNCGHVFAGDFGPEFRRTFSVKGDAINLAARVMGKAAPGQVLATREVIARSATLFHTDALEPFMVKGKALPVHAVSVGPVIGEQSHDDGDGPFVGREAELAMLGEALSLARARTGSFIDLVGEPGIGKSRLVQEFRRIADDMVILNGQSGAYQSSTAYFPFRGLLRQALGVDADTDGAAVAARLQDRASQNAPELVPWLPLLAIPLDIDIVPTRQTRELEEGFRKPKLEDVTIELLRLLLPTPTVFNFGDAHLMDDASADLLHRLEAEVARQPWVVLVTRRDQASGFVPSGNTTGYTRIDLSPMDAAASLELLAFASQNSGLTKQAMQALADRAGGNPLFLRSLVLEAGRSGTVSDLPDTIEGVVSSQVDRLDPHDRTLLRYASVLGMRFPEALLREMLAGAARPMDDDAVQRLSDFLQRDGADALQFRHALIRDVAYAGLPFRLRRDMHERVGTAIESSLDNPELQSELLSLHFFHAGRYDKAWTYSRIAGDRVRAQYAYVEAGEFFERALDSAKRQGDVAVSELAAVSEALGDVRALAGMSPEAVDAYRLARVHLSTQPVASAGLMYKEARTQLRLGKFSQSLRVLSRGIRLLADIDEAPAAAVRSQLATRYGFGRYLQGRSRDAIRWCMTGAQEAERAQDKAALAEAYNVLHLAHLHSERREDAPYGNLALQIYLELGDLAGEGHCTNNLAIGAHQEGRWADAEQMFGRAAEIFARIGDVPNEGNAIYNRADLLVRQARFAEAEPLLQEVLRTARAVSDEELVALALRESGKACAGLRQIQRAAQYFEDARVRFEQLGLARELVDLDAAVAELQLRSGHPESAVALLDVAIGRCRDGGAADLLPRLLRLRAIAYLELDAVSSATADIEAGLRAHDGSDGGYELAMLLLAKVWLARLQGDADGDEPEAKAHAILHDLGVDPAADLTGAYDLTLDAV